MKYGQLTYEKRYQIYAYSKANWAQKEIARELKVHRSAIYGEKRRNQGLRGYRPDQAHRRAQERKQGSRKFIKMTSYLKFQIAQKIRQEWTSEQISGYFKRYKLLDISHQTIYAFVQEDRQNGELPYKYPYRPRKTLSYATPKEIFFGLINNGSLLYQNVALVI